LLDARVLNELVNSRQSPTVGRVAYTVVRWSRLGALVELSTTYTTVDTGLVYC